MRLAFYQPDIPQNLGAALRLAACFAIPVDIIEPVGFPLANRALRRAAMDYGDLADTVRHASWPSFLASPSRAGRRLVLFTTRADMPLTEFRFSMTDTLLFGRESAGVPEYVRESSDANVRIPLQPGARSLNVVVAAGIALWEGLRQTDALNPSTP